MTFQSHTSGANTVPSNVSFLTLTIFAKNQQPEQQKHQENKHVPAPSETEDSPA